MRECEIFFVEKGTVRGWKWRTLPRSPQSEVCEEVHGLFYECVTDARRRGFTPIPELKCT